MAATARGASLDPGTYTGGGFVPDGDYAIKDVKCGTFDYGGKANGTPVVMISFDDENGGITEQPYSWGAKAGMVTATEDGKWFLDGEGEPAHIVKNSNAALFFGSILKSGFPSDRVQVPDVTVVKWSRVTITNVAQPARPGLADQKEGKTIPLVSKVLAVPGVKATARPTSAKPAAATASSAATPASTSTNGDTDAIAIGAVVEALQAAPEHSLKIKGLAVRCLKFAPGTKLNDLTKLITPEWLANNADAAGWATDGETVGM